MEAELLWRDGKGRDTAQVGQPPTGDSCYAGQERRKLAIEEGLVVVGCIGVLEALLGILN